MDNIFYNLTRSENAIIHDVFIDMLSDRSPSDFLTTMCFYLKNDSCLLVRKEIIAERIMWLFKVHRARYRIQFMSNDETRKACIEGDDLRKICLGLKSVIKSQLLNPTL